MADTKMSWRVVGVRNGSPYHINVEASDIEEALAHGRNHFQRVGFIVEIIKVEKNSPRVRFSIGKFFHQLWWRFHRRCSNCGGPLQRRAHVSCKGESWAMISHYDRVCLSCDHVQ